MAGAERTSGRRRKLLLAAAVLLSFLVRMIPWGMVFGGGGEPVLDQFDAYYHLRRVMVILETFPAVPTVDRYMAYPLGAECPWPPLFDLVAAGLSWVAGLGTPSAATVATVLALLPALLGAVTVVPLYVLAVAVLGSPAALPAAFFFTALPGHLSYSIVGSGDHHSAETLLLVTCYALFARAIQEHGPAGKRMAVLSGVALGGAALVWQGAIVFGVPVVAGILLHRFDPPRPAEGVDRGTGQAVEGVLRAGATVLAVALLSSAAGRAIYPSGTAQTRFDFGHFSWFQPAFFLLLLSVLLSVKAMPSVRRLLPRQAPALPAALGLFVAAAGGVLLVPVLRENLAAGITFLLGRHPFLDGIQEFASPLRGPFPADDFGRVAKSLELASLFLPPAMAAFVVATERRRLGGLAAPMAFLAAWTFLFALLAFLQVRWLNAYSVNLALSFGWVVATLRARGGRRAPLLAAVAALVLAVPSARSVAEATRFLPAVSPARVEALVWLRDHSPPTSHLWDSAGPPEYSVLAYWDMGHLVQWFARRPSVSNNFGYQLPGEGLEDSLRIQFSTDEDSLLALCERRGVRYIVLDQADVLSPSEGLPSLIGVDFEKRFLQVEQGNDGTRRSFAREEYRALPFTRLFLDRGSASVHGSALTRLRLVHESPSPTGESSGTVRVFERVKGARVMGRGVPGEEVLLSCRLDAGGGRPFDYVASARADREGVYSSSFPYATESPNGSVFPLGDGVAWAGGRKVGVFLVREEDVISGGIVRIPSR